MQNKFLMIWTLCLLVITTCSIILFSKNITLVKAYAFNQDATMNLYLDGTEVLP